MTQMTKRQERSSQSPSIKELLEALTEEERRATAPFPPASQCPTTTPTGNHHAVPSAPALNGSHPAHIALAALTAQTNGWAAAPPQSATDIDFELGNGANVGPFDRAAHRAQAPHRASPPPPSPSIAIDAQDARYANYDDDAFVQARPHVNRERAFKLLQSHLRVPWIARHAFAAAGALAVILPSALYLTTPVRDRMANEQTAGPPVAAIVQRGIAVTDVNTASAEPKAAASQRAPSDARVSADRFATASLGLLDQFAPLPSVPAPVPAHAQVNAMTTGTASLPTPDGSQVHEPPLKLSPNASRTMTPERAAALLARGRELAVSRDITAARQYFQRAAEGGSAQAALEAARTYDPAQLKELGLIGLKADPQRAREFYRQAEAGGIAGVGELLARLPAR